MSDLLKLAEQSAPKPPESYRAETTAETIAQAHANDARAHEGTDRLKPRGTVTRKVTYRKRGRAMSSTYVESARPELLAECSRAAGRLKGLTREEREDIAAETAIKIARRIALKSAPACKCGLRNADYVTTPCETEPDRVPLCEECVKDSGLPAERIPAVWEPTRRQLAHVWVYGAVLQVVNDQSAWRATKADATVETNPVEEDGAPLLAQADPYRADLPTVDDFSAEQIADELALPENARAAVIAALSGYGSGRELGNAWGISESAADKRLSRGRAELRKVYPKPRDLLAAIQEAVADLLRTETDRDRPALNPCERAAFSAVDSALAGTPAERRARLIGAVRTAYAASDYPQVQRLVRAPLRTPLANAGKEARHRSRMLAQEPRPDRTPDAWETETNHGSRARLVLAHIDRVLASAVAPAEYPARGTCRHWNALPADPTAEHRPDPALNVWAMSVRYETKRAEHASRAVSVLRYVGTVMSGLED